MSGIYQSGKMFRTFDCDGRPNPIDQRYVEQVLVANPKQAYDALVNEAQEKIVEAALTMYRGNQTRAAEHLGINRATLRKVVARMRENIRESCRG